MDAPKDYVDFIGSVKDRIRNAQYAALKAVNKELIGLYWDIGKMISEKRSELGWGKSVVERIAMDLQKEFPGQIGFSARNLWLMVDYYIEYKDDIILQPLAAEISFTHNIMILTKCQNRHERQFYILATKKYGWTKRIFDLGGDFSFIGSQFRLTLGGEDFFIDLVLFHRGLQCLVAIELKAGSFKPEYKGKMEFYLNVLNDFHRKPHENEAIGIIICRSKNRMVVEYSLKKSGSPIGIASYSTSAHLPEIYEKALPTAEQIERGLGRWMGGL